MTGANIITYYATTIFRQSLGFATHEAAILATGLLTWKIVAASLAYHFIDPAGRKPLFMIWGFGMGLSMMCLAITRLPNITPRRWPGIDLFLVLIHVLLPTWVSRLQLPLWRRNRPPGIAHSSVCHRNSISLDVQFCYRRGNTNCFYEHWIQVLYRVCMHWVGRCSHGVFLVT